MLIAPIAPLPIVSVEAVNPQENPKVFRELTLTFEDMIAEFKKTGKVFLQKKRLQDIFKIHMNLFVEFEMEKYPKPNAYVVAPQIDVNHPLVNRWRQYFSERTDGLASIRWGGEGVEGSVDLENAKVSGFFSKLVNRVYITTGCITSGMFEPEEIAAVVLHEIGHLMTYFTYLGQVDTTCFILTHFARSALGVNEKQHRVKLFSELKEKTGVDVTKNEELLNTTDEKTMQVVLLTEVVNQSRSEFGTSLYDNRSWESLSDQFASRMGAGRALSTGLFKIMNQVDPNSYRNTLTYFVMELVKVVGYILMATIAVMSFNFLLMYMSIMVLLVSPHEREYDKPRERLTRIKRDLVSQMKSPALPKPRAVQLTSDVKVIDGLLADLKDRETVLEKLYLMVSPATRAQKAKREELQNLESLMNNDLFTAAAQLRVLS